jgi:galactokinase
VNLIGEHIDYSNYSVLPMALSDRDILIACRSSPTTTPKVASVTLENMDPRFPSRSIQLRTRDQGYLDIDAAVHEWSNYFKSGLKVHAYIFRLFEFLWGH